MRHLALALALATTVVAGPDAARALPGPLRDALGAYAAAAAAARGDDGSSGSTQALYDTARDLEEAVRVRTTLDCVPLRDALRRYAAAQVAQAEAVDRIDHAAVGRARAARLRAAEAVAAGRDDCTGMRRLAPDAPPGATLPSLPDTLARLLDRPPPRPDPRLAARLAAAARAFPGIAGIAVSDLARGRSAGWQADVRFPAASTVKLAVIAATLATARGRGDAEVAHDLRAIATWSSNLAANRLAARLGDAAVERMLRRLGATSSTYTGAYRVGTAVSRRAAAPPLVSRRITTAADLDAVLRTFVRGAAGWRSAIARSGLSRADARTALALLLLADGRGDNEGIVAPFVPAGIAVAQKNGWISDARHTAAVVLTRGGPVVVVVLTYRDGLTSTEARALGGRVVRAALG